MKKNTEASRVALTIVMVLGIGWAFLNAPILIGLTVAGLGAAMVAMHWRAEIRHAELLRILAERQPVQSVPLIAPGDWSPPKVSP